MNNNEQVVIPLSKRKIILVLIGAAVLVAVGVWLVSLEPAEIRSYQGSRSPQVVYGVAYVCIGFFGLGGVYGILKLFDSKPGLIVDADGIWDNASAAAAGRIHWGEITGFDQFQMKRTRILIVRVRNPGKYVRRGNVLKRALNRMNMNMAGSPIAISAASLEMEYDELVELCTSRFDQYRQSA